MALRLSICRLSKAKKCTAYGSFHGNGSYGAIPTRKEPIRFTSRLLCHMITDYNILCRQRKIICRYVTLRYTLRESKTKPVPYYSKCAALNDQISTTDISIILDITDDSLYRNESPIRPVLLVWLQKNWVLTGVTLCFQFLTKNACKCIKKRGTL